MQRSKETLLRIISFIEDTLKANNRRDRMMESTRSRGISVTSKEKYDERKRGIFSSTNKSMKISICNYYETEGAEDDQI